MPVRCQPCRRNGHAMASYYFVQKTSALQRLFCIVLQEVLYWEPFVILPPPQSHIFLPLSGRPFPGGTVREGSCGSVAVGHSPVVTCLSWAEALVCPGVIVSCTGSAASASVRAACSGVCGDLQNTKIFFLCTQAVSCSCTIRSRPGEF